MLDDATQPIKEMFTVADDEQIHHVLPLRMFNALFRGTNPEEAKELAYALNSGNQLVNLMVTPKEAHQAGVHKRLREKGLEIGAAKLHPLLQELEVSEGTSMDYKRHLVEQIKEELIPLIKREYDEEMTDYYEREKQTKDEPKRMAGDALVGQSVRSRSPGENRERALIINSEGGDVTIGQDVLRSNGNGHHRK